LILIVFTSGAILAPVNEYTPQALIKRATIINIYSLITFKLLFYIVLVNLPIQGAF